MVEKVKETFSVRYMSDLPYSLSLDGGVEARHYISYNAENFASEEEAFDWVKKEFKKKRMNAPHFFIDKIIAPEEGRKKVEYGKAQYIGGILSDDAFQSIYEGEKSNGYNPMLNPVHQHEDLKRKYPWFDASVKGYVVAGKNGNVYPFYEGETVWNNDFKKIFPMENDLDAGFKNAEQKLRKKSQEESNANVGANLSLDNDR